MRKTRAVYAPDKPATMLCDHSCYVLLRAADPQATHFLGQKEERTHPAVSLNVPAQNLISHQTRALILPYIIIPGFPHHTRGIFTQARHPTYGKLPIGYHFEKIFVNEDVQEQSVQPDRVAFRGAKAARGPPLRKQQTKEIDIFTVLSLQFFVLFSSIDSAPWLPGVLERD